MGERICSITGCERPQLALGLCEPHYRVVQRGRQSRTCTVEGCTKAHRARGMCGMHYFRWKKYGSVELPDPTPRLCSVEDCGRPVNAHGLCFMHERRLKKYGSVDGRHIPMRAQPCRIEGCPENARSKGLCASHYGRLCRHGDPEAESRRGKGSVNKHGYRVLTKRDHPNADKNGHILEHRFVMAEMLGRPLEPFENVHHRNGQRADNRPENLELWATIQPCGKRPADLVEFAKRIMDLYGVFVAEEPREETNMNSISPARPGRKGA